MKLVATLLATTVALAGTIASVAAQTQTEVTTTTTTSTPAAAFTLPAEQSFIVVDPGTARVVGKWSTKMRFPNGFFIVEEATGRAVAALDSTGKLVALTAEPGALLMTKLETQQASFDQAVADALTKKVLTEAQATALRGDFAKFQTDFSTVRSAGDFTFMKVGPLAARWSTLNAQLSPVSVATVGKVTTAGNAAPIVIPSKDYSARRQILNQLIDRELAAGRLTQSQVVELREDLNEVAVLEHEKKLDGSWSGSTRRKIERRLNRVASELRDALADQMKRRSLGSRIHLD